jgi:hypothetical protein
VRTTGPVIAMGAVTLVNASIFHGQPINWRIPIGVALTAGMFALGEKAWPEGAIALAWLAFGAVLLVRVQPDVPAPTETALDWWNKIGG